MALSTCPFWNISPNHHWRMAQFYSIGDLNDPATATKLEEMVQAIPKLQHNLPKVPLSYTILQMPLSDKATERILENSTVPAFLRYCHVCFSISRDLCVFSTDRERSPTETGECIHWKADLRNLASTAEIGCSFCSFVPCRFFNDTGSSPRLGGFYRTTEAPNWMLRSERGRDTRGT